MKSVLLTLPEATEAIQNGKRLLLAADEEILSALPSGSWVGGTTPYFMTSESGVCSRDKVFATELPDEIVSVRITELDAAHLPDIYENMPCNGFGIVILPAGSVVHREFAMNAPYYTNFAGGPLAGWISGTHVSEIGHRTAKAYSGASASRDGDKAVVLYAELPGSHYADIEILNLFEPSNAETITFDQAGFSAKTARIDGREVPFADYVLKTELDTRLPLVADYCGAMINISFQSVDPETGIVTFYAPVFPHIPYHHAKPIADYVTAFLSKMRREHVRTMVFSCNCILNYLYSELEGKSTGGIAGPITFGEIAYQLLNQTMVYLTVSPLEQAA
jgi:hypothetical protein